MTNEKELRQKLDDIFEDMNSYTGEKLAEDELFDRVLELLHSHTKEVVKMAKKIVIENTPAHFTREYRDTDLMRDKICKSLASLGDNKPTEELLGKNAVIDYANNYSHYHCWNQTQPPACGIPLEKHTHCCLCGQIYEDNKK